MKEEKKHLTHERLSGKFKNGFDLVNYAIKLARLNIEEQTPKRLSEIVEELELLPDLDA